MIWGISCLQFCKKSADHKEGNTCSEVPIKVFCNSIGWVKSARALNSWMTSVSYARDRAPKYCIEIAWDSHYIKSKIAQIPMTVFAKL